MGDWQTVKLDEVASLGGGFAFKSSQYTPCGRFILRTINITDDYAITRNGATFISEVEAQEYERFSLQEYDTLFVMVAATLGKIGLVRRKDLPALLNQNMWVIRAREGRISPAYLHYVFRELSKIPLAWVGGSARSFLRRDDVRNLTFVLPPMVVQTRIAELLSALDDKIELNRRMNETLEASARALFRDWFVDFGPTRAKAEGRPAYLAPDLWSFFPDRLDDDGVPEGWTLGTLGNIAQSVDWKVEPSKIDLDTPYIGLEHMPRRSVALADWEGAGKVSSAKSGFKTGQILFGKLRPYFHKVGLAPLDGICSTDIVVMEVKQERHAAMLLACVSSDDFVAFADQSSTGTKMPRTSWPMMSRYPLPIPAPALADRFQSVAAPMLEQIMANIHASRILAATRDALLPKLMSGELRVRDAEALAA